MFAIGVLFSLLVTLNIAVFYFWIVYKIGQRGYGSATREERKSRMMPHTEGAAAAAR